MKARCLVQGKHFDHDQGWALLVLAAAHQSTTILQTHFEFGNTVCAWRKTKAERPSNLSKSAAPQNKPRQPHLQCPRARKRICTVVLTVLTLSMDGSISNSGTPAAASPKKNLSSLICRTNQDYITHPKSVPIATTERDCHSASCGHAWVKHTKKEMLSGLAMAKMPSKKRPRRPNHVSITLTL